MGPRLSRMTMTSMWRLRKKTCGEVLGEFFVPEPGAQVEAYWPGDDTWLPATVTQVLGSGQIKISWASDSSSSSVPADYIQDPSTGFIATVPKPSKRQRTCL